MLQFVIKQSKSFIENSRSKNIVANPLSSRKHNNSSRKSHLRSHSKYQIYVTSRCDSKESYYIRGIGNPTPISKSIYKSKIHFEKDKAHSRPTTTPSPTKLKWSRKHQEVVSKGSSRIDRKFKRNTRVASSKSISSK